ncbi:Holliday junction resolvase RuvX [Candidatus Daviesbacteria bacterium]|nr:Holliday junction resolvase RuvX [Candidatus Daviesbacteria bacterium]
MRFLGIDYGKRKVGFAISEGLTASPYKVINISSLKDALAQVLQILLKENIDRVVIGVPESGEALNITKKFIAELTKIQPPRFDIVEVAETLSSQGAKAQMIEQGLGKKSRATEDAYSATIILQDYLDSQKA